MPHVTRRKHARNVRFEIVRITVERPAIGRLSAMK
jgi:hypothetical protein